MWFKSKSREEIKHMNKYRKYFTSFPGLEAKRNTSQPEDAFTSSRNISMGKQPVLNFEKHKLLICITEFHATPFTRSPPCPNKLEPIRKRLINTPANRIAFYSSWVTGSSRAYTLSPGMQGVTAEVRNLHENKNLFAITDTFSAFYNIG